LHVRPVDHLQRLHLFESNVAISAPRPCDHSDHKWVAGAYGGARRDKHEARYVRKGGYVPPDKDVVKRLMGIEHDVTWNGLFESIPPAYTEHIGRQLIAAIEPPQEAPESPASTSASQEGAEA
jgi:DNA (cytosine-5)-methyltransferase 1